ncbi:MAG: hypothetical protein ACLSFO_03915 [Anaerovoracaceae bacterium]
MMRLAITGCGGVGKALINLLDSRRGALAAEGLDIQVNYVLEYYGGIYNKDGIDLSALFEFVQNEKDITKFDGGSKDITIDTVVENGDVDLAVIMTPNKETGEPGFIRKTASRYPRGYVGQRPCPRSL